MTEMTTRVAVTRVPGGRDDDSVVVVEKTLALRRPSSLVAERRAEQLLEVGVVDH